MHKNFFMNRYYVYDLSKFKVAAYTVEYIAYDKAFLWLYLGILKNQSQCYTTVFTILSNFKNQSQRSTTVFTILRNFKNQSKCFMTKHFYDYT